jgi:hypothetical protein
MNERAVSQFAQRHVSQHGGFTSRTGNLVRRTGANVVRTKDRRLVKIRNTAKYAPAQDGGSGLHGPRRQKYVIRPKRPGGCLVFYAGGRLVITRKVMHPGVKPTRFLYNANDAAFRVAGHWLRGAIERAAKKF